MIGVAGEDIKENENFINLDLCLENNGMNVPHFICASEDMNCYLLQDLGDVSLLNELNGNNKLIVAKEALDNLIKLQKLPESIWTDKVGYAPFGERLARWDLNYFKYDFLKPYNISFDEEKLENDFDLLTQRLNSSSIERGFMYRDFQSRNIMVYENKLWFIDFQGARKGPVAYDAVSFIWQAKAPFTNEERESLANYYSNKFADKNISSERMMEQLKLMRIFRALQVLGAYGFRGLIEKKPHFIESLPLGINNLIYLRNTGILDEYTEITEITKKLEEKKTEFTPTEADKLTIRVFSFSYKKGYPEDISGNGGGFMFDCRAIHNPGRYDGYKQLTGRDLPVIEFLERNDEARNFVKGAIMIVKPSVERYLKRGFTSLQTGFGCTGGRHRSVYCAELFAKEIKKLYPEVKIELIHREQDLKFEM